MNLFNMFSEGEMEKFLLKNGYVLETILTSDDIQIYSVRVAYSKNARPEFVENNPEMYKIEGIFYQELKKKLLEL